MAPKVTLAPLWIIGLLAMMPAMGLLGPLLILGLTAGGLWLLNSWTGAT